MISSHYSKLSGKKSRMSTTNKLPSAKRMFCLVDVIAPSFPYTNGHRKSISIIIFKIDRAICLPHRKISSSKAEEFHPHPLTEPDVKLSLHPALTDQPPLDDLALPHGSSRFRLTLDFSRPVQSLGSCPMTTLAKKFPFRDIPMLMNEQPKPS